MKQNRKTLLSVMVLSGAIGLTAGPTWSQDKPTPGTGTAPSGATQQKDDTLKQQPGGRAGADAGKVGAGSEVGKGEAGKMGDTGSKAASGRMGAQKYSEETIKDVQQALKDKGHDPGAIDGIMGPNTRQALRDFQNKNKIKATGVIDEETAQKLGVSLNGGKAAAKPEGKESSEKASEPKSPAREPSQKQK